MKKALIVGIDDYSGSPLSGCVADARAMEGVLSRHEDGNRNYEVRLVVGEAGAAVVDRPTLRSLLAELFENSRDDDLLFYFAGHGAQTDWGGELVTQDFSEHSLGVSMDDVITLANNSPAREVVIVLDCCFSGEIGNVRALQAAGVDPAFRFGRVLLRENVMVMAASHELETAAEKEGHGAFTRLLLDGLEGAAADHLGHVTALSLYAFASRAFGAWEQRPVFKANIVEPSSLRMSSPFVEAELLRRLPQYFEAPDARLRMNPEYEGAGRPLPTGELGTPEQRAFDYFKALRNASLLATEGDKDLYFVALASEEVYLTPLGRYFWGLAKGGRL